MFFFFFNLQSFVLEQWNTYNDQHERHFLDLYFKEIAQAKLEGKEQSPYSGNN